MRFFILLLMISSVAYGQHQQPNILWITLEDTSPQFIGCYGNKAAKTPNIDRLAREGVRFTNAFANSPVCSAARSTIITGVLNVALGTGNHRSNYPLPDFIKGFPSYLKRNGWYTSNNVKTDYATSDTKRLVRESWHESSQNAGWGGRSGDQPFFSVFNHTASHQSRTMTNPYRWYENFVYDKLEKELVTSENEFEMPPFLRDTPEMRRHVARIYNSITLADRNIGLLLDSLQQDGLMDETIIFLYADHGEAIPGGKSGSVGIGYKVPFIVWFPEKYKHLSPWGTETVSDELIGFDDLAPTVLSLAGLEAPDYMSGRAIMGRYRTPPKSYVFLARNRIDETPGLTRSISDGRFIYSKVFLPQFPELKYQKYADVSEIVRQIRNDYKEGALNEEQATLLERRDYSEYLYDLENDPWKVNNLITGENYQKKKKELKKRLKEHILEVRDVMFIPEYSLHQLSAQITPYEFRLSDEYRIDNIMNTAFLAGEEDAEGELRIRLESQDDYVLYWALVGLHGLKEVDWTVMKDKIFSLTNHPYPPVRVIASIIAWEEFNDENAFDQIRLFIRDADPWVALQTIQFLQYAGRDDFNEDLLKMIELKKDNKAFTNPVSAAETMLFYSTGRALYYDHMKKWQ